MNTISNAVLAFVITSGTAAAGHAAGVDQNDLDACKSEVSKYYGDASDVKYMGKRHYRDGLQMKLAVDSEDETTGYTTTRLVTCWLGADNYQASSGSEGTEALVANINDAATRGVEITIP